MLEDFRGLKKTVRFAQAGFFKLGKQMWYLSSEVLNRDMQSAVGVPVILEHNSEGKQYGVITNVWMEDDWVIADMIITDENMANVLSANDYGGYKTSNGYNAETDEGSFSLNGVSYDVEVKGLDFRHLALTKAPRYKGAVILNSKEVDMIELNGKEYDPKYVAECVATVENMAEVKAEKASGLLSTLTSFFKAKVENSEEPKGEEEKVENKCDEKKVESKSDKKEEDKKDSEDKKSEEKASEKEDKAEDEKEAESKDEDKKEDEDKKTNKDVKNSLTTAVSSEAFEFVEKKY